MFRYQFSVQIKLVRHTVSLNCLISSYCILSVLGPCSDRALKKHLCQLYLWLGRYLQAMMQHGWRLNLQWHHEAAKTELLFEINIKELNLCHTNTWSNFYYNVRVIVILNSCARSGSTVIGLYSLINCMIHMLKTLFLFKEVIAFESVMYWGTVWSCKVTIFTVGWIISPFCGCVAVCVCVCDCEAVNLSEIALGKAADTINQKILNTNMRRDF